jgi:hypothetical protein
MDHVSDTLSLLVRNIGLDATMPVVWILLATMLILGACIGYVVAELQAWLIRRWRARRQIRHRHYLELSDPMRAAFPPAAQPRVRVRPAWMVERDQG